MITIVTDGGPEDMGRVRRIDQEEIPERWVVAYYGRHQHFERTSATELVGGLRVPVFRFTYSTAIAE
ncbi:DUF5988 family protein [Streptomyces sp. MNP-20]|uniref:DUF5988 family protein n=1 Tax=Streptomyces sp. MNP-20 TaxID=2721165 RepID=UPI001557DB71|nr:DUF5988 family protein [Streptomyces sp. MNP-20]